MAGCDLFKAAKIMLYVTKLRFPKHPPYVFPFYMLILYNRIRKFEEIFKIQAVPSELLHKIIENYGLPFCDDVNNIIVVNNNYLKECGIDGNFIKIVIAPNTTRIVYIIGTKINRNLAILSDNLKFNLQQIDAIKLKPINPANIIFAAEIDLALINTHHDLNNALIDTLVKNYFKTPKFVRKGDLLAINFKQYAPEFFYTTTKVTGLKTVYFKCNKVLDKTSREIGDCCLCIIGETTIKQSANVQDFVAPILKKMRDFECENWDDYASCVIEPCPYGLEKHLEALERAVKPFLKKNELRLSPAFLLRGSKGSGKNLIVSSLAAKLGLHLYETTSGDVTASVYAQTETKIRNIFFRAKLCTPCILTIKNFENLGKNNEGQHDERIMSFFKQELENLFRNNQFPLVLVCLSNSKEVPSELSRAFLEVFDVAAPSEEERLQILKWILMEKKLKNEANLEEIAGKTHGFLFEDFQALVFYAQKHSGNVLQEKDFDQALDLMQSKYSQSLGAPKIPKVQWSDVGGLADVKHEIIRTINLPLRHPELLKSTGLKRSGILLYGPPGTGKTLIAKAVATECNLCFLSVKGPELLNMYVGQSEHNVREVFERAREASPCIIFFDELDSLAPNRGISGDSGGVMDRVVSQLLAEMDGLNQSATIFIIGATNRPDLIDPALLRPGRFDKLLYVGPCTDVESKIGVLEALTRKFKLGKDANLRDIVGVCPKNITGADFYGLCSNAWMSAVRKLIGKIENEGLEGMTHENVVVTMEDFQTAIKDLKPSIKSEDLVFFENLRRQLSVGGNKSKSVNK